VITIEVNGGPGAVAAARHAIEQLAERTGLPRVEDLRLLVSELVTNSVIHGGAGPDDRVRLTVVRRNGHVRVEVCNEGGGWSEPTRSPSLDSAEPPGGWGLMLVGEIADSWGISVEGPTRVWFEVATADDRRPVAA
jgi:anti-sigma regulatory factor (Ser/Thr protein kinase)